MYCLNRLGMSDGKGELRGMVEHSPLMDEKAYARLVEDAFEDIL